MPVRRGLPCYKKSAVYKIGNKINGKCYVGSTARSLHERLANHRNMLRRGQHPTLHLQRAWNKYGEEAFEFVMLEACEPERCLEREDWWIDRLDAYGSGYNGCPKARSRLGTKHTEESKAKNRASHLGKKASDEVRAKMSESQKERLKDSEERKKCAPRVHWSKGPNAELIAEKIGKGLRVGSYGAQRREAISEGRQRQLAAKRAAQAAANKEPTLFD